MSQFVAKTPLILSFSRHLSLSYPLGAHFILYSLKNCFFVNLFFCFFVFLFSPSRAIFNIYNIYIIFNIFKNYCIKTHPPLRTISPPKMKKWKNNFTNLQKNKKIQAGPNGWNCLYINVKWLYYTHLAYMDLVQFQRCDYCSISNRKSKNALISEEFVSFIWRICRNAVSLRR